MLRGIASVAEKHTDGRVLKKVVNHPMMRKAYLEL